MYFVSFMSEWLKDIVVMFSIISIIELIMPKGNMKKYINMVIGLLIIFSIINPFQKLLKLNINFSQSVFNQYRLMEFDNSFHDKQEKQIEQFYKERLSQEMTVLIEENSEYDVSDVYLEIGDSGSMDEIIITLGNKGKEKVIVEKVKPIKEFYTNEKEDFEELKEILSLAYLVNKDIIKIND